MVFTRAHGDKGIDESLHTWSIIALRSPITVFTLNADLKTASGLNARKLRPAWLTADLALLDANIVSHTWLIYLHSNERREATTYIKHVFTFDRFQAVTATKWGRTHQSMVYQAFVHLFCWYLCRERWPNDKQPLNGQWCQVAECSHAQRMFIFATAAKHNIMLY